MSLWARVRAGIGYIKLYYSLKFYHEILNNFLHAYLAGFGGGGAVPEVGENKNQAQQDCERENNEFQRIYRPLQYHPA